MNRRNYQRELEAVIKENESKSRVPRLLFIVAARHAAAMYWNIYPIILRLRYFTIIPIFLRQRNMKNGQRSSSI